MKGVIIIEAYRYIPGCTGFPVLSKPPLYVAVPECLKHSRFVIDTNTRSIISTNDKLLSTLHLKPFISPNIEELEKVVANFFKEDDPYVLLNWLV